METFLRKNLPLFILLILVFLTRFLFLSYPAEIVFDEVHFGKFVSAYFTHQYYFDIHPPLGKLLIAGFGKIFGFQDNFNPSTSSGQVFAKIGEVLDQKTLFLLRFLPAFMGALFVLLIYVLILELGASRKAAFLGAFLVLFDNAFLVESKFILVDMFLIFFGFLSFYLFILAKKQTLLRHQILFYSGSALSVGLTFSIKWTGLSFLAIYLLFIIWSLFKNFKFREFFLKLAIFTIIPILIYVSFFAIHFSLLPKSGPGNNFMSSAFQKTLQENIVGTEVEPLHFWGKFTELNARMFLASATLKAGHSNASFWYEWPLMRKPIWYWTKNLDGKVANIYLLGNPVVWWSITLSILIVLFSLFFKQFRRKFSSFIYILIFGFFINLFPFIFISRVTFLYHYLPSLVFGILILALFLDKNFLSIPKKEEKPYRLQKLIQKGKPLQKKEFLTFSSKYHFFFYFGFLIVVFLVFLALAPLSYGFPVSAKINQIYDIFIKFLS